MALRELTEFEPQINEDREGITQSREFMAASQAEIPRVGASATGIGSFPSMWIVKSVSSQRQGTDENGADAWRVNVTAGGGVNESDGGDPNDVDELPRFGFKVALATSSIGTAASKVKFPNFSLTFWVKKKYHVSDYLSTVSTIANAMGGINSAAGDPFPGAVALSWRYTGAPMEWISDKYCEVEHQYTHAGRDKEGALATWATRWSDDFGVTLHNNFKTVIGHTFNWP